MFNGNYGAGINSAQQLLELLELAQQVKQLGGIERILDENEALRLENDAFRAQLQGAHVDVQVASGYRPYPQFPQDFYHFTEEEGKGLTNEEIQGLIDEAQTLELAAGEDTYLSAVNVVVFVGRDNGDRVTLVAKNFYELIENEDTSLVAGDVYTFKFNV